MKLTRAQIIASIFLGILIIILIGCYLFYPTNTQKTEIPKMEKKTLNQFVTIEKMTKNQFKNDPFYPYIKSYEKDLVYIDQLPEEEQTKFQRELSLTELEITKTIAGAKLNNKKNSVEVTRTVTSSLNGSILEVTVYYHLTGQKEYYIQLIADMNQNKTISTTDILEKKKIKKQDFSNTIIDKLFDVLNEKSATLVDKKNVEQEIDIEKWKQNREDYLNTIEKEINTYSYAIVNQDLFIYYTYDQILEQLGFQLNGITDSSELKNYKFQL